MQAQAAAMHESTHSPHQEYVYGHARGAGAPGDPAAGVPESQRTYAVFNHLVGLLSLLDATVLGLIGAAIMWRIKHGESAFLDDHGRESLNFQISLLIYVVVGSLITFGAGALLLVPAAWIVRLVFCIKGAMAANRGQLFRYPVTIRFF